MRFVELRQCDEDRVLQSQPFAVGCVNSLTLRIESAKTLDLIELVEKILEFLGRHN